jgi:hypothetical protein
VVTEPSRHGTWLLLLTVALVLGGCVLYASQNVGWAQMLWVLASGTAGAGVVLLLEGRP